jgi:hypothetical protein
MMGMYIERITGLKLLHNSIYSFTTCDIYYVP